MLVSSAVLWIGCLLVYLSSPNQKLLTRSLRKKLTYLFSLGCFCVSWYVLLPSYSGVIAFIIIVIQAMVMWPSTVFILSHTKPSLVLYLLSGGAFFSSISFLGLTL